MPFFRHKFDDLRLDIVGFLAILGEGSVATNAQNCSASRFSYLPRLLPAPQAFMRPERPSSLQTAPGTIVGVWSGNLRYHVGYFADVLHDGNSLPRFAVRCVSVTKTRDASSVHPKSGGPLSYLSILGTLMSIESIILSIRYNDGMGLLATILLSLTSTLVGIGSKWHLVLPTRGHNRPTPQADIVIKYPHAAFLVVRCTEEVARELYIAPEACQYDVSRTKYRALSLFATLLLMIGVIMMGNANQVLQFNFAGAYMILNAAYWIVAALPRDWHWDLSRYTITREPYSIGEVRAAEYSGTTRTDDASWSQVHAGEEEIASSFTEALWRAIALTRTSQWVRMAAIAPATAGWDQWLRRAEDMLPMVDIGGTASKDEERMTRIPKWDWNGALTDALDPRSDSRMV